MDPKRFRGMENKKFLSVNRAKVWRSAFVKLNASLIRKLHSLCIVKYKREKLVFKIRLNDYFCRKTF